MQILATMMKMVHVSIEYFAYSTVISVFPICIEQISVTETVLKGIKYFLLQQCVEKLSLQQSLSKLQCLIVVARRV